MRSGRAIDAQRERRSVTEVGWWMHCGTLLVFLNLLPLSKHFHIITALPNVFFGKLPPRSPERPLAITQVPAASVAALEGPPKGLIGAGSLADLTWKQVLDSFTCTECGRCTAVCPATASGTPLAPRQVILEIRDRLYQHPDDQRGSRRPGAGDQPGGVVVLHHLHGVRRGLPRGDRARADDHRHAPQAGLRGRARPLLEQTLENYGEQGNSFGKSSRMRAGWARGLDFKIADARKERVDYLWLVGDFASFDERVKHASETVARVLLRQRPRVDPVSPERRGYQYAAWKRSTGSPETVHHTTTAM